MFTAAWNAHRRAHTHTHTMCMRCLAGWYSALKSDAVHLDVVQSSLIGRSLIGRTCQTPIDIVIWAEHARIATTSATSTSSLGTPPKILAHNDQNILLYAFGGAMRRKTTSSLEFSSEVPFARSACSSIPLNEQLTRHSPWMQHSHRFCRNNHGLTRIFATNCRA